MKRLRGIQRSIRIIGIILAATVMLAAGADSSEAFTLNVEGCSADNICAPLPGGFRYLVEEDTTHPVTPGIPAPNTLGVSIHRSYAPVVIKGTELSSSAAIGVPSDKRYAVSVLPSSGNYTLGGANVAVGQSSVTVKVNLMPIPTAQISVFIFNDNRPISNAPDTPFESGLANFSVLLFDQAGQMMYDAFGNPLGTTYNPDGSVAAMGTGVILTDANGEAQIKNIAPGKYGVRAVPPGDASQWVQTSTIEGTPGIDAWVKANEPNRLIEFGPALHHVFIGFVQPMNALSTLPNPGGTTGTITGQVVAVHTSRPPALLTYTGNPVGECWIGLNMSVGATQEGVYAQPCNADSTFSIAGVPPGTYQIVMWDKPLDYIFAFNTVIVPATGGTVDVGQLAMNAWFGTFKGSVFYDTNQDGFRDAGESGIMGQNVNIRFRDGSVYQAAPTDMMGDYEFVEVFPFFKWLVTEVDFARFKATGMTAVVDDGGPLAPGADNTPQIQADSNPYRTETGPVLTQSMTLYADQTNIIDWGKANYGAGENGGITGIVFYDTTRAENSPRYNGGEPWQPGIPRVQVCLYEDLDMDGVIDDIDGNPGVQLCDVDNYPFGWLEGAAPREPEDVVRNGDGIIFSFGDALQVASTDSWDDNLPTGCVGPQQIVQGQPVIDCAETLKTWNQVRPAIFDGGYAFGSPAGSPDLAAGTYIVESVLPTGYEIVKEEDKNVDFGESYEPGPLLIAPLFSPYCVGTIDNGQPLHVVPDELSLFSGVSIDPPLAGSATPLCNMKQVIVRQGQNTAADFFFFTEVPKAARGVGLINNDLGIVPIVDVNNPMFGEKAGASWIPISVQDFKGNEMVRAYTDQWGSYNFLVPSTYSINVPNPTGVSPNMLRICLNHPGPIPDPANPGLSIMDPNFDARFSLVCYTLDFWPGKTTYLDTPVVPNSAFAELATATLDCELPDGTPVVSDVTGPGGVGPYVAGTGTTVTIISPGTVSVKNPDCASFDPLCAATVSRNFGFGTTPGTVTVGNVALTNLTWSNTSISGTIQAGTVTGQLVVKRGDNNKSSVEGITLTVGGPAPTVVSPGGSIQAAVDAAAAGALIIVRPGSYNENVIVWKNVRLQGSGAYTTIINAAATTPEKMQLWRDKLNGLVAGGSVSLVPGEAPDIQLEAAGVTVLGKNDGSFATAGRAKIDGFSITSAPGGGGITVNGYASNLDIGNNRIVNNAGMYGGGVRVGTPSLIDAACTGYCGSSNSNIRIHHNHIAQNGAVGGAIGGGGIGIFNGADAYNVTDNYICGNFSSNRGGGIADFGYSPGGLISNNKVLFNESSFGTLTGGEGGGIMIKGEPAAVAGGLSPGTGSKSVIGNLIQGNLAGSGNGGGVLLSFVNGADVAAGNPAVGYSVQLTNNIIVNNVAGFGGGGIFLEDTVNSSIINNTVANNDTTATGANAFEGGPTAQSTPQASGVVARVHSVDLAAVIGSGFSNPVLVNNIIWNNRSFYWDPTLNGGTGGLASNAIWDLQVIGTATPQILNPQDCLLSSTTGYGGADNIAANPLFVNGYLNGLQTAVAPQEGGNFVSVTFLPAKPAGDYHIQATSPARNQGRPAGAPATDYDGDPRSIVDIGADEVFNAGGGTFTGSVVINSGAVATRSLTVTLTFNATSSVGTVTNRRLSWNNGATWSGWTAYSPTATSTMPAGPDGTKTVSVQFRNSVGSVSAIYTDTILLDRVVPTGSVLINGGAASTVSRNVTLTLSATDTATSVTSMRWSWITGGFGPWVNYATTADATITGSFGTKTIQVQFRDIAGNVSPTYRDSISFQAGP